MYFVLQDCAEFNPWAWMHITEKVAVDLKYRPVYKNKNKVISFIHSTYFVIIYYDVIIACK